uniref:Uncharacterized protein n=2 Tax=Oryza TaxID=4527 RepID=Q2R3C0_ORYSJ|nr:hypothetical protein LOC_Os11g32460 [Oryza sativa Japonica Group]
MAADATTTASALRARAAEFRNRAEKLRELLVVDDEPEEGITRDVARNLLRILVEQNAMIVEDAGMDLEEGEIVEDAAMAQEQGEGEEVEGKQDEVMVDGKRIPSELWDLVSLDDDEIASAQEVARARIRHGKEMEKVWLHLSHIDHDDFRALDSACLDYLSIKRFSEPILQASELLDTIRSRDWASALERRAAELDTEAASLET